MRRVVDARGTEWEVWEEGVRPVLADGPVPRGRGRAASASRLCFESATQRRELARYPMDWGAIPEPALVALCAQAQVARRPWEPPPWVVEGEENVGLWKRVVKPNVVEVEVRLAPGLSADRRRTVREAAQRLASFHSRDLSYTENEGTPHLWGGAQGHPSRRPRRADR